MRRRLLDVTVVLTIGMWVVVGGWLFGDAQPRAFGPWHSCAYCTGAFACVRTVGTCSGCGGGPFGLCNGTYNPFSWCWDGPHCWGTDTVTFLACPCTRVACF